MSEIPKAYDPGQVEDKWHQFWLDRRCFTADPARADERRPPYAIVIPPPNVTGMLHMGHVLNNTIQDILARKARMDGKETLWLPGTDHAGIATQAVVEKTLIKQGVMKHREELGREKFLEKVWEWKERHGGIIIRQLRKLGCSCDWTRERFTMDPEYSRCVQLVFVDLFRKGRIYRGKRMVNWDPAARTALSDEEVEMREVRSHLWHFRYPLLRPDGRPEQGQWLTVATTRPETMLGDEAVAVNPKDPRYSRFVGRQCLLPLQEKPIPVIADELVDPEFGTGCVKVTPAHDPADYEMAVRHNLPFTVVIAPDGRMTEAAGERFAGMDRMEAREAVVEAMKAAGLLERIEDYTHNVGFSQRTHVPIEPYLSEQWFLKYPSVKPALACVLEGRLKFHPDRWVKVYEHWMRNLKDWCISRQLWWGHRIPVWTRRLASGEEETLPWPEVAELARGAGGEGSSKTLSLTGRPGAETTVRASRAEDQEGTLILAATAHEAEAEALEAAGFDQDPDVLDTWFSSWLWPFATMGWPERTETLKTFYPTDDLVTGPDILFFWVARMIMAGYEYMGEMPFRNVYFTGIIRDKLGRKMSKSLGNSPDPLELIDKYGADALRFGVMRSAPLGQDVLFDERDVELGRNFCNKLWNACRFRQLQGGETLRPIRPELLLSDDRWILLRLDRAIREIDRAYAEYRFNEATQTLHRFFWSEFCDWHLEAAKAPIQSGDPERRANALAVLDFVLHRALRLFHPFLPFITEELWHGLGYGRSLPPDRGGETIMYAPWPEPLAEEEKGAWGVSEEAAALAEAKHELVRRGRDFRREFRIPVSKKLRFVLKPERPIPEEELAVMGLLLNAESLEALPDYEPPRGTPTAISALGRLYLPLAGVIDPAAERRRLEKELEKVRGEIEKARRKLQNPNFVERAPASVVAAHRDRLRQFETREAQLEELVGQLAQ
ncbi:MAG: valine--tRNA ligase [Verrucomicrobia bacterium]|nr:valine--tRNA ligase [Verrucomicrobiota bacterium]